MTGKITAIVAVHSSGVIGVNGGLPWYIPEDLKFFKEQTAGGILLMGGTTYQELCDCKFKPADRHLVVVSYTLWVHHGNHVSLPVPAYLTPNTSVALSRAQAIEGKPLFVIGGATLLDALTDYVDSYLITEVDGPLDIPARATTVTHWQLPPGLVLESRSELFTCGKYSYRRAVYCRKTPR